MRVLVTGAAGLLGAHLAASYAGTDDVLGLDRHPWWGDEPVDVLVGDLDGGEAERAIARHRPEVFFHCAALVDVDRCERAPDVAFAANAALPARLARAVGPDCLFVYIATDGVFQGDRPFATEDMPPQPRTAYGRSKLQGEIAVAAATPNHLILRTNFFGWSSGRKRSSAEWLYAALQGDAPVTLFDDFFFTPIYVIDFVSAVRRLIDGGTRGLVHLAGGERVSKYDFGMLMAGQAGLGASHVQRGSIDAAALAAPRPKDMSLDTSRAAALLGHPLPSAAEGVAAFLADRDRPLSVRAAAARGGVRA